MIKHRLSDTFFVILLVILVIMTVFFFMKSEDLLIKDNKTEQNVSITSTPLVTNTPFVNTVEPTSEPANTQKPIIIIRITPMPTEAPTEEPTSESTEAPTVAPTEEPTAEPTEATTVAPTEEPTKAPTVAPTEVPTAEPTKVPTVAPTEVPTAEPTKVPTEVPTVEPTVAPTVTNNGNLMAKYIKIKEELSYLTIDDGIYPEYYLQPTYDLYDYISVDELEAKTTFELLKTPFENGIAVWTNMQFDDSKVGVDALKSALDSSGCMLCNRIKVVTYTKANHDAIIKVFEEIENADDYEPACEVLLNYLYTNTMKNPNNPYERLIASCDCNE